LLRSGDPRETLERLLKERTPIYSEADITLDSEDGPHTAVVERIVALLTECGALTP
jgi:shikimate kinase